MALAELENLLKQTMGLSATSIGESTIERAVQERRLACGLPDQQAYWACVRSSEAELQELIEALVVPETWFFRYGEAFAALAEVAGRASFRGAVGAPLRLLSLPCATGEEPYSMAMALLDAGFSASQFHIDAVDISLRALQKAEYANYGKNSFRSHDLGFRDRYFEATADGYRLADNVRGQVHFQQGNLLSPLSFPQPACYDIIFCRNLLIYFDRATQDQAIAMLAQLLTARGLLFIGHAETSLLASHGFTSAKLPSAFAFHKVDQLPPQPAPSLIRPIRLPSPHPAPLSRVAAMANRSTLPPGSVTAAHRPAPPPVATHQPEASLDEAGRLADQGQLAAAAQLCQAHLCTHGPSAQVFHLMGLLSDADGNTVEAASFYRKALYLDPEHGETLIHLAFLLEKQGDTANAQRLHARAQRLKEKGRN